MSGDGASRARLGRRAGIRLDADGPIPTDSDLGRAALVPARAPLALLGAAARAGLDPRFYWQDDASAFIALGEVDRVEASGPDRLRRIDAALAERVARDPAARARWIGGFAFEPEVQGPFTPFGSARFVRPRALWTLALGAPHGRLEASPDVSAELWDRLIEWACADAVIPAAYSGGAVVDPGDPGAWGQAIAGARAAFAAGEARKVVLSRDVCVQRAESIDPARILAGLPPRSSAEVAYAVMAGGAAFLGLTPERLLRVEPGRVRTEALAGSSAAEDPSGLALLESTKDLEEHRFVVEHLRERLSALIGPVDLPERPQVRRLGNLAHLCTPIEGIWTGAPSILRLAEALHPTPAVGGTPADAALRIITRAEGRPRGWYAGGVGFIEPDQNGSGRGELRVALRSALVQGSEARVFVGGGIVPASTAEGEWRETALKAARLVAALGGR